MAGLPTTGIAKCTFNITKSKNMTPGDVYLYIAIASTIVIL
jgi:hypothetical protein